MQEDFRDGFWFGLLLARTLRHEDLSDRDAIATQLRSVSNGDLTLMPSRAESMRDLQPLIEETYRQMEAAAGRPLSEEERDAVRNRAESCIPANRPEQDARNRELANVILRIDKMH